MTEGRCHHRGSWNDHYTTFDQLSNGLSTYVLKYSNCLFNRLSVLLVLLCVIVYVLTKEQCWLTIWSFDRWATVLIILLRCKASSLGTCSENDRKLQHLVKRNDKLCF